MTTSVNVHDVASVAINRSFLPDCKAATVEIIGCGADGDRLVRIVLFAKDADQIPVELSSGFYTSTELAQYRAIRENVVEYFRGKNTNGLLSAIAILRQIEAIKP